MGNPQSDSARILSHRLGVLICLAPLWQIAGCNREAQQGHGSRAFAINHVSVIDTRGGPTHADMTVIVSDGKIAELGSSSEIKIPTGLDQIDGTAKFIIPGLNDMHAHQTQDTRFVGPLMIANGVTGVREMFARDLNTIQKRRSEVARGALHPNILLAGPIVDGDPPSWSGSVVVRNKAEAEAAVDKIKRDGYDFVKVYSSLNRESYFAIASESKRIGIPFEGHVTSEVTDWEASQAGQRAIEHLYGVAEACSSAEDRLIQETHDAALNHNGPANYLAQRETLVTTFDENKCQKLYKLFVENQTWQIPTLTIENVNGGMLDPAIYNPPYLKYVPYLTRTIWSIARRGFAANITPESAKIYRAAFTDQTRQITGEMVNAGVPVMTGTDEPNPFVVPGFSLHDELANFVKSGLTPMQALQSSTIMPARFLGRENTMGSVEKGKDANLVFLESDPLANIENVRQIYAVVLNGQLISKQQLEQLKTGVLNSRWVPDGSGLTFLGIILNQTKYFLLALLAVLIGLVVGFRYLLRRRRRKRAAMA